MQTAATGDDLMAAEVGRRQKWTELRELFVIVGNKIINDDGPNGRREVRRLGSMS